MKRLFTLIVCATLTFAVLGTAGCADTSQEDEIVSEEEAGSAQQTERLQEATVVRVVDGDTLIVDIDGESYRLRLIGLDAPESVAPEEERNTEEGVASSDYTKAALPEGTVVWLEKDVSDVDQYDRLLRYVWVELPDDPDDPDEVAAKMFNAILIEDGYAEAKRYEPDTKWNDLFDELMVER